MPAPRLRVARTVVLTIKLTTLETFILGAILASAEGVQLHVALSQHAHDAITIAILLLGAFVKPITASQFLARIPAQVTSIIQAGLGAILVLERSWNLGSVGVTVVAVVIVIASTLGLGPTPAPPAVAAAKK